MGPFGIAAIAAGSSILGGLTSSWLGAKYDKKAQEREHAYNLEAERRNAELQREFAKMGIRWRVEDAKAAGLHPLAALGMSPVSAQPVAVGASPDWRRNFGERMGQSVSRAVEVGMDAFERQAYRAKNALEIERLGLENELLRTQVTKVGQSMGPPMASTDPNSGIGIPGQMSGKALESPMTFIPTGRTYASENNASKAFGSVTDWYFRRTPTGLKIAPSPDVQGILANNAIEMLKWESEHFARQTFQPEAYKPNIKEFPLPKGMIWYWNGLAREWRPAYPEEVGLKGLWNKIKSLRRN